MKIRNLGLGFIGFILFFCCTVLSSHGTTHNGYYSKETGAGFEFYDAMARYATPTIDGVLAPGEWDSALARDFYKYDREDNRIRIMFQHDAVNLYILVQVDDDKLWDDSGENLWETWDDDGLEIFIDPDNSRDLFLQDSDRLIAFTITDRRSRFDKGDNAGSTQYYGEQTLIKRKIGVIGTVNDNSDLDTGYLAEIAVPWAHLSGVPGPGSMISVNIQVVEDDDGGPLTIFYDESSWDEPFETDRYFKWFGDGLTGPANFARVFLLSPQDSTPPGQISDLALADPRPYSCFMEFTAPGDDGAAGQASQYQIRFTTLGPIVDQDTWEAATDYPNAFVPKKFGESESLRLLGLEAETLYYVGIRAVDHAGNLGPISNSAQVFTAALPGDYGKGPIIPSPVGRYFVFEDGDAFIPIPQPAGIPWFNIRDLYTRPLWDDTQKKYVTWSDSTETGYADTYLAGLSQKGINLISIFIDDMGLAEYAPDVPDGVPYLEYPVTSDGTHYIPETLKFLGDFLTLCAKYDIYVTISPWDTYFFRTFHPEEESPTMDAWAKNPYNQANGGPCETWDDFVTDPDARAAQKKRLEILNAIVREHPNFFGWQLINEWDNDTFATRGSDWNESWQNRFAWIKDLHACLRGLDREHMIFLSSVIWQPQGAVKDFELASDLFDFAGIHNYTKSVRDPLSNPDQDRSIRPASDGARMVSYRLNSTLDRRPVYDLEFGPIDLDDYVSDYNQDTDEKAFLNVSWAEFASGAAGMPLRWPCSSLEDRGPLLTEQMWDYQENMARFVKGTQIDFTCFPGRPWRRNINITPDAAGSNAHVFATSDGDQGLVFVQEAGYLDNQAQLTLTNLAREGTYDFETWDIESNFPTFDRFRMTSQDGNVIIPMDRVKGRILSFKKVDPTTPFPSIDIPNSGFERGAEGWVMGQSGTSDALFSVESDPETGASAAALAFTGSGSAHISNKVSIPIHDSGYYTFSLMAGTAGSPEALTLSVFRAGEADAQPLEQVISETRTNPSSQFQIYTVENIQLVQGDYVRLEMGIRGAAGANHKAFFDDISLTRQSGEILHELVVKLDRENTSGPAPFIRDFKPIITGGKAPFTVTWDFGDGTTGSGETVSHTYTGGGSFFPRVTVEDALGSKVSDSVEIFVVALDSISISPATIMLTHPDAEKRLLAKGLNNDGTPVVPDGVTWSSSDTGVADMVGDLVRAKSSGEAVITAVVGDLKAQATVKVAFVPIGLETDLSLVFLEKDQTYTPDIYALYPDGARKKITEYTLSVKSGAGLSIQGSGLKAVDAGFSVVAVQSGNLVLEFMVDVSAPVPLGISPSRVKIEKSLPITVMIQGGTRPYKVETGSVTGDRWELTSPDSGGTYTYRVTDAGGEVVSLGVTVPEPLEILNESGGGISSMTLDQGESITLTATGGTPPYEWTATAGELSGTGTGSNAIVTYLTPSVSGTQTVTVTDNGAQTRDVAVSTIKALQVTPQVLYTSPGETREIEITGGSLPYTAAAQAGEIGHPSQGKISYTAPGVEGDYLVEITDNRGKTIQVHVTVSLPMLVSPCQAYLRREESRTFTLAGGVGRDEDFFITALKGDVPQHPTERSFTYTAPKVTGRDTLMITDKGGTQVFVEITVSSDNFFITPLNVTMLKGEDRRFRTVGGTGDARVWTVDQGDIKDNTQPSIEYTSPGIMGDLALTATDEESRKAEAAIHVISDQVKITPGRVYLKPGEKARFRALFGTEEYTFTWTRGEAEADGEKALNYTAPARTGIHFVTVFDSAGNSAQAEVVVSGGFQRSKILETKLFKVTSPGIYPDSRTQPAAVGDVQEDGDTFSLALDFPNYEDDNGDPLPTNFYVGAHIPAWDLFFLFDDKGGLHELDAIQPCMAGVTDAVYTELLSFDYCSPDLPVDVNMYILAVESGYDPDGNLTLVPGDAPFELWYYDFSFGKCQLNGER